MYPHAVIPNPLFGQYLPLIAIMESGNAVGPPWNGTDWHQPMYDRIVDAVGYVSSQHSYINSC
jgi:hypothetical protein